METNNNWSVPIYVVAGRSKKALLSRIGSSNKPNAKAKAKAKGSRSWRKLSWRNLSRRKLSSRNLVAPEEHSGGNWNTAVAEEWDATDDVDAPEEVSYPWSEPRCTWQTAAFNAQWECLVSQSREKVKVYEAKVARSRVKAKALKAKVATYRQRAKGLDDEAYVRRQVMWQMMRRVKSPTVPRMGVGV